MPFDNAKYTRLLLICCYEKIGSGPCCIVISLIIIFFLNSNCFGLALHDDQWTFFSSLVFNGAPYDNIRASFTLSTMPIGNSDLLPHLLQLVLIFIC